MNTSGAPSARPPAASLEPDGLGLHDVLGNGAPTADLGWLRFRAVRTRSSGVRQGRGWCAAALGDDRSP